MHGQMLPRELLFNLWWHYLLLLRLPACPHILSSSLSLSLSRSLFWLNPRFYYFPYPEKCSPLRRLASIFRFCVTSSLAHSLLLLFHFIHIIEAHAHTKRTLTHIIHTHAHTHIHTPHRQSRTRTTKSLMQIHTDTYAHIHMQPCTLRAKCIEEVVVEVVVEIVVVVVLAAAAAVRS